MRFVGFVVIDSEVFYKSTPIGITSERPPTHLPPKGRHRAHVLHGQSYGMSVTWTEMRDSHITCLAFNTMNVRIRHGGARCSHSLLLFA